MNRISYSSLMALLLLLSLLLPKLSFSAEINLAAANSTCKAIRQIGDSYKQRTGININYICKSSGRLAKGLNGNTIQADAYISANKKWMDYMIKHGLMDASHVTSPWGNELVVAVPASSPIKMKSWQDLAGADIKTILLGDPGTAPFGRYAKEALQHTGLWNDVRIKVVTKKHITLLAETLANSGPNTVGILFKSNTTDKLRVLFPVDATWHSPIRYFMGPVGNAVENPVVMDLLTYMQEQESREIFRASGFKLDAE